MARYGRYELVGKLATGGMAEVFLAKAVGPGGFEKKLVLKRIRPQFAEKASFVKMFLAEARIAAQFDHQNIVQIFDFGEAEGAHYLAMEFIDGLDLRSLLRWSQLTERPLPLPVVARIIAQACDGLAYAHEFRDPETNELMGLVHRDVSPENIIVSRGGAVKVLDFGVAKIEGDGQQTRAGTLKGKVAYMPLEQVRGEEVDLRIDVYALGVVLYQLLTGHKPYEQQPEVALIAAILSGPPPTVLERRPDLPFELAAVVHRAMERDREQRFANCRELHVALEGFISMQRESVGASHLSQLVIEAQASGLLGSQLSWSSTGGSTGSRASRAGERGSSVSSPGSEAGSSPSISARLGGAPQAPTGTAPVSTAPLGELGPEPPTAPGAAAQPARPPPSSPRVTAQPAAPPPSSPRVTAQPAAPPPSSPRIGPAGSTRVSLPRLSAQSAEPPPSAPRGDLNAQPTRPSAPAAAPPSDALARSARADPTTATTRPEAPAAAPPAQSAPPSSPRPGPPPGEAERASPPLAPRQPLALGDDDPEDTDAGLSDQRAALPGPPPAPAGATGAPQQVAAPARAPVPNLLVHHTFWVASAPVQESLRQAATNERAKVLARKFPVLAARLLESNAELPPAVADALAALLDATLLSEDFATLKAALERVAGQARFAALMAAELSSPLRVAWLAERLRAEAPVDTASLLGLLSILGEPLVPLLVWAIETSESGPAQDLLCKALGPMVAANPALVVAKLEAPSPRQVAAWCLVLEAGQAVDRQKTFHKLLGQRNPALSMQVMTGRMKAQTAESFVTIEAGLGDKSEDIRRHALKLLGEALDSRAAGLLTSQLTAPGFETRSLAERSATWAALVSTGQRPLRALLDQALAVKTTLLNKKKSVDAKLAVVEGLASATGDAAGPMLERLTADKTQPDEVLAAARAALARRQKVAANDPARPTPERRKALLRALCLDFFCLVRASTAVDLATGVLDPALDRLRENLRLLLLQDGRCELVASSAGLTVNGVAVAFSTPGEDLGVTLARLLHARDVRGLSLDVPIPLPVMRLAFLRQFDPAGAGEKAPHVTITTFSGKPVVPPPPAPPGDAATRARDLYLAAVVLLQKEREAVLTNQAPSFTAAQGLLDEWAQLYASGAPLMLSLLPTQSGDEAFAIEAANIALVSMSFAADLGLGATHVRELAELALFSNLAEQALPPERRTAPGEPASEELRLRTARNFLQAFKNRRAVAYAVTSIEVGLLTQGEAARAHSVQASILALAQAWDTLARAGRLGHQRALQEMGSKFKKRFHPELLGLFTLWAGRQLEASRP